MKQKYYNQTVKKNRIIEGIDVLTFDEYVREYSKKNPSFKDFVQGSPFPFPQNCFGNVQFFATGPLRNEWDYIEGVMYNIFQGYYTHHAWAYSRSLKCYVETCPLDPWDRDYYISNIVRGAKKIDKLVIKSEDEEGEVTYTPSWINKNVEPSIWSLDGVA